MMKPLLNDNDCSLLRELIDGATNIVICCHVNPDGDALGSSLGWASYLRSLGKDATIIVPDKYPDFLQWLPHSERILRYDKHTQHAELLLKTADLLFCLDFNNPSRTDAMASLIETIQAKKVMLDHHLDPSLPGCTVMVSEPELSSTCEVVARVVMQLGGFEALGKDFAVPIYCGMMTDTGGFTYNSARPEIYHIIGELLAKGIDKDRIYRNVYHTWSENRLRLTGYVLYERLVVDTARHASFFALTRRDLKRFHFVKGDAEGLVNMPLQMKGMKLSISLREDTERDNLVWVSLRSVDNFPCNEMAAEFFNGGGHLNASGGRLQCSIEEAQQIARQAILHYESKLK